MIRVPINKQLYNYPGVSQGHRHSGSPGRIHRQAEVSIPYFLTRRLLWSYFHEKQLDAFLCINEVFEKGFTKARSFTAKPFLCCPVSKIRLSNIFWGAPFEPYPIIKPLQKFCSGFVLFLIAFQPSIARAWS